MLLTQALKASRARKRDNALSTIQSLISRSHDVAIDDGDKLDEAMSLLGTDDQTIDADQTQHLAAMEHQRTQRERRERYESLQRERHQRQLAAAFSAITPDMLHDGLECALLKLVIDPEAVAKFSRDERISDFLLSHKWSHQRGIWYFGGVPVNRDVAIEREFTAGYVPLLEACQNYIDVPPLPGVPESLTEADIATLEAEVQSLDAADDRLSLAAMVVDGFQLFIHPTPGIDRKAIRIHFEEGIVRISGLLITRIDTRRRDVQHAAIQETTHV